MSAREIVRVDDLVKDFRPGFGLRRKRVLHGISFRVHEGEIFGFVGPNGAGKTTTLRMLAGVFPPTGGHAFIHDHDVNSAAAEVIHSAGSRMKNMHIKSGSQQG